MYALIESDSGLGFNRYIGKGAMDGIWKLTRCKGDYGAVWENKRIALKFDADGRCVTYTEPWVVRALFVERLPRR